LLLAGFVAADLAGVDAGRLGEVGLGEPQLCAAAADDLGQPSADVVPTFLRDLFGFRWALRCSTPQASDTILGSGWASEGYSAAQIDPTARGVGLLLQEGGCRCGCARVGWTIWSWPSWQGGPSSCGA
jgi:hypothetical protein